MNTQDTDTIQTLRELDRKLYYEEGGSPKDEGTMSQLWNQINEEKPSEDTKMKWILKKLRENYISWNKLEMKQRIPLIRKNLQVLLAELTKKPSQ